MIFLFFSPSLEDERALDGRRAVGLEHERVRARLERQRLAVDLLGERSAVELHADVGAEPAAACADRGRRVGMMASSSASHFVQSFVRSAGHASRAQIAAWAFAASGLAVLAKRLGLLVGGDARRVGVRGRSDDARERRSRARPYGATAASATSHARDSTSASVRERHEIGAGAGELRVRGVPRAERAVGVDRRGVDVVAARRRADAAGDVEPALERDEREIVERLRELRHGLPGAERAVGVDLRGEHDVGRRARAVDAAARDEEVAVARDEARLEDLVVGAGVHERGLLGERLQSVPAATSTFAISTDAVRPPATGARPPTT